jgi:hypothetical protein
VVEMTTWWGDFGSGVALFTDQFESSKDIICYSCVSHLPPSGERWGSEILSPFPILLLVRLWGSNSAAQAEARNYSGTTS